ncbi:MAG: DUF4389 domain-containing protein [Candidatus Hodarchaeales archaeon]|jgi:hypothetical protein
MEEYPIKIEVGYEEKASRLEALIIRWLYAIVLVLVIEIWGIVAVLAGVAQWIVILITGSRNQGLHNFMAGFFRYYTRVYAYLLLLTDVRPPISGK